MDSWLRPGRWWTLGIILPAVLVIHLVAAAFTIRHSNQDMTASDQGAEMWLAATSRPDAFPQRTDGVRHPLWSWLARHVFVEDQGQFFERGKWLNTAIVIAFLCAMGAAASRWLDPLATANLLLLCSLGILLVRGTYFQPEPIYYLSFFLVLICAWKILRGAPWGIYPILGFLCGVAFLAKPSLMPFLLVFFAALALRILLTRIAGDREWKISRAVSGAAVACLMLAALAAPLGFFSQKHFGRPFFNYPKYWMWMDDFQTEAWPWQKKYPGRIQLETLSREEFPSVRWYFQRHDFGDAARRLWDGGRQVKTRFFFPESKRSSRAFFWKPGAKKWEQPLAHRGIYLITLAALCVGLSVLCGMSVLRYLRRPGNLACVFLAAGTAAAYVLLYGWYWPIGRGDRFMGSLWMPAVFLLVWLAFILRETAATRAGKGIYLGVHAAILASILLQTASLFWLFHQGIFLTTRN